MTLRVSPSGVFGSVSLATTLPLALATPRVAAPLARMPASTTDRPSSRPTGAALATCASENVPLANWKVSTLVTLSVPSRPGWVSAMVVTSDGLPVDEMA